MSFDKHKNFALAHVALAPTPSTSGTELTIRSGEDEFLPEAPFNAFVFPTGVEPNSSNAEIIRVTEVDGITLTVVREQEGTIAQSITSGYNLRVGVTAQTLTDIESRTPNDFVTASNKKFWLHGEEFKGVWGNYYPLIGASQMEMGQFLDSYKKKGSDVVRFWMFDRPEFEAMRAEYVVTGTNLHANPSVETNLTGFTAGDLTALNGAVWTRVSTDSKDGDYSLRIDSSNGTYDFATYKVTGLTINTDYVWTIWYKGALNWDGNGSHLAVGQWVGDETNSSSGREVLDGNLIDANTDGQWRMRQVKFNTGAHTAVCLNLVNFGGENHYNFDKFHFGLATTPVVGVTERAFAQFDKLVYEAGKRDMKIIPVYLDGVAANYASTNRFLNLHDSMFGTSYPTIDGSNVDAYNFFAQEGVIQLFEDWLTAFIGHTSEITGIPYAESPEIFSHEIGNELRVDHSESDTNTENSENMILISNPGGWADRISTHIHDLDPNHMISFGDMAHNWQWKNNPANPAQEDGVYNGTYYGPDWNKLLALPYISYGDFHVYPNQGNNVDLGMTSGKFWGIKLGFDPDTEQGAGFVAQLHEYVDDSHSFGKPVLLGEIGFVQEMTGSNDEYTLDPRDAAFEAIFEDFLDYGGNGIVIWTLHGGTSSSSYNVALDQTGGEDVAGNLDDTRLNYLIKRWNEKLNSKIPASRREDWNKWNEEHTAQWLATSGTVIPDLSKGKILTLTPTGAVTINMTNGVESAGNVITLVVTTSGTSSYNITFGTGFKSTGVLATGVVSAKVFVVRFMSDGTNYNEVSRTGAM